MTPPGLPRAFDPEPPCMYCMICNIYIPFVPLDPADRIPKLASEGLAGINDFKSNFFHDHTYGSIICCLDLLPDLSTSIVPGAAWHEITNFTSFPRNQLAALNIPFKSFVSTIYLFPLSIQTLSSVYLLQHMPESQWSSSDVIGSFPPCVSTWYSFQGKH